MDEAELTRKAIEEIMREMNAQSEADKLPQIQERKKNPLGKPNKDFLDRTLNSVMTHNRRQLERNQRKCQKKLRDMDDARGEENSKRQSRNISRNHRKTQRKRKYSQSSSSSSLRSNSPAIKDRNPKLKKVKKKQKKNRKKERSMSSSSSSSSLSSSLGSCSSSSSYNSNSKSARNRRRPKEEDFVEGFYGPYGENPDPSSVGYYVDPNVALAAMALSHMNQLMQQQQQQQSMHDLVKEELQEDNVVDDSKVDIFSDLSLTYNSESELNVSVNSSSAEEDENGVFTFNLSSDEENTKKKTAKPLAKSVESKRIPAKIRRKSRKSIQIAGNDTDDSDTQSQISSESNKSRKKRHQTIEEVTVLSSSSETEGTLLKQVDVITTISSSSASSESENDERQRHQEEITIISSCSSSSDTEDETAAETTEIVGSLGKEKDSVHISPTGKTEDVIDLNESNEENTNADLENSSLGNLSNENEQEFKNPNSNTNSLASDLLNEGSEKKQVETNALESITLKQNELKATETSSTKKLQEKINLGNENENIKEPDIIIENLTLDTRIEDSMSLAQYEKTNVETLPSKKQEDSCKNETASNNSPLKHSTLLVKENKTATIALNEENPNQAEMPTCSAENLSVYKEASFIENELVDLKTPLTQKEIVNQDKEKKTDATNSLTMETEDNRPPIPKEVNSLETSTLPKHKDVNVKDCSHATPNEIINDENVPLVIGEDKNNKESNQLAGKLFEDRETEDSLKNETNDAEVPHTRKQDEITTSSDEVRKEKKTTHSLNKDVEDYEKREQDNLALITKSAGTPASILYSNTSRDSIKEEFRKNTENCGNVEENIKEDTNGKLEAKNKEDDQDVRKENADVSNEETPKEPANDILIDLTDD